MGNIEIWQGLYETVALWNKLKPWLDIYSNDYIRIDFPDDNNYYCTIMGKLGNCIGLAIYQDEDGFADLCSLTDEAEHELVKFLGLDQSCISFYMGNRDEVPNQQKKIIKELGLKYRGNGNWPYFLEFKKAFVPYHINEEQALLTKVMKRLMDIMINYRNKKIDVKFDEDELIYAHYDNNNWIYEPMCVEYIDKFCPIELCNKEILSKLEHSSKNNHNLIMDLVYLDTSFNEKEFDRPIKPRLFMVLDETSQMIIHHDLLTPNDDEIETVIDLLVAYILQDGIPNKIFIRNPIIWSAIVDICDRCNIDLQVTPLPIIDDIINEMF